VADWLALGAAPTFGVMALLTGILDRGPANPLCSGTANAWPLGGMVPMYLLMSAFHLAPWLRLIADRRPRSCWGGLLSVGSACDRSS
jgi:hypothetical protein